jgi:hypothetical protein
MLSTNKTMFNNVLNMERDESGKIQWANLFDNKSVYRKIYSFEIIEALLQQSEIFGDNKKVEFVCLNKLPIHGKWNPPTWIRPAEKAGAEGSEVNFNDQASKDAWMTAFVEEGGFQYALKALLNYDMALVSKDGKQRNFDLKDLSFLMTLMKVFLLGAFESKSDMDYKLPVQRKSSNVSVEEETEEKKESQFNARLRTIMQNNGESLIKDIDLPSLSNKLLQIISTMLAV